nr:hypothetical protein [uncultured bacterium]
MDMHRLDHIAKRNDPLSVLLVSLCRTERDQLLTQREQVRSQFEQVLETLWMFDGMNLGTNVQLEGIQPTEMNASSGTGTTKGQLSRDQAYRSQKKIEEPC